VLVQPAQQDSLIGESRRIRARLPNVGRGDLSKEEAGARWIGPGGSGFRIDVEESPKEGFEFGGGKALQVIGVGSGDDADRFHDALLWKVRCAVR